MRAWFMRQPVLIRNGLVLVTLVAAFVVGMVVQRHTAGGSDGYAGCGAGAPDWAQESADACAAFEAQSATDDQGDTSGYDQQQANQDRLREFQQQQQEQRQQQADNYNCQVGPMFCPR